MTESDDLRIGVFVCNCGLNIAGTVDCAAVAKYAGTLPGVAHADHLLFACSDDGQENKIFDLVDDDDEFNDP